MDPMMDNYRLLARYNTWFNACLFDACERLDDAARKAPRGAFFGSIHATLNHLLCADRIWMKRFTGEGDAPDRLDAILYEQFDSLCAAREAEDRRIVDWIRSLDSDSHRPAQPSLAPTNSLSALQWLDATLPEPPPEPIVRQAMTGADVAARDLLAAYAPAGLRRNTLGDRIDVESLLAGVS